MDDVVRAAVRVSAAMMADAQSLERALHAAATTAGATELVEEALLQSYLFAGYPAALNALGLWRRLTGTPAPPAAADDWQAFADRGDEVCARVYGGQYEPLRANIAALHPDMERWMLTEGYGKVLGRPGMDLTARELCIVALLAGQDTPRQLYAHLRGALNVGASPSEVEEALAIAAAEQSQARASAARDVWVSVRQRQAGEA